MMVKKILNDQKITQPITFGINLQSNKYYPFDLVKEIMDYQNADARSVVTWIGSFVVVLLFSAPAKDIFGKNGVVKNKSTSNLASGRFMVT